MNELLKKMGDYLIEKNDGKHLYPYEGINNTEISMIQDVFNIKSRGTVLQAVKQLHTVGLLDDKDNIILDGSEFEEKMNEYSKNFPDITIDRGLVHEENEKAVKTRVPGTYGDNIRYMWLSKDNVTEVNEGKTLLAFIDLNRKYKLYGKNNEVVQTMNGNELYSHYSEVNDSVRNRVTNKNKEDGFVIGESGATKSLEGNMPHKKTHQENINDKALETESQSQPEIQTEDEKPEQSPVSVDLPIKTAALGGFYDRASDKIVALEAKNSKYNTQKNVLMEKLNRTQGFIEKCDKLIEGSVLPAPVNALLKVLVEQQNERVASLENKINARNEKISSNEQKILKQKQKISTYQKIDKFLQNMKSPDGRRDNFIQGLVEMREISLKRTNDKLANLNNKISHSIHTLNNTRYVQEKQKLISKLESLNGKKLKLDAKLVKLQKFDLKLEDVKAASEQSVDNIVSKSYDGIMNSIAEDPTGFAKKNIDTVIDVCSEKIDGEISTEKVNIRPDQENAEKSKAKVIAVKQKQRAAEKTQKSPFPMSRNQIRKNAATIANNKPQQTQQKEKTRSKGQEI